jgi:uncharacterized protein (DUF362 family)
MPSVVVRDTTENLVADLAAAFDRFGGIKKLAAGRPVLIKPNGVSFGPGQFTATEFLEALFKLLRDSGLSEIFLMEACTAGNITRVVFRALKWDALCKKYGVKAVCLDEGKAQPLLLSGEDRPVRISRFLYERLIKHRAENFYLSAPRLKTHSMSHVTLGIKNQQGLLSPFDRMKDHNFNLGKRLVKILEKFRPDFTLLEGLTATIYGHFPLLRDLGKSIIQTKVIVGGDEVVAVDTVGARIFGYDAKEIDHIRIAGELGLGCADLSKIEVIGDLSRFKERYPYLPDLQIPVSIRRIYGKQMACTQGCRGNAEAAMDMMCGDYGGRGGWNFVAGKGIDKQELEGLHGPILVVGPCAVEEVGAYLKEKYGGRNLLLVPEHNDLANMSGYVMRLTKVNYFKLVPIPLLASVRALLKATLRGSHARVANPLLPTRKR